MDKGMKGLLSKAAASGLDLLFPLHCMGCGKEGTLICLPCVAGLPRLSPPFCNLCAQPISGKGCRRCAEVSLEVDGIRSPFLMEGVIREGVHSLKYHSVRAAATQLGQLLAEYLMSHPVLGEVMVPVPLHPRRLRSRGYNQSALLAREVSKLTGLPVKEELLVRIKDAPPQAGVGSREERRRNVAGGFQCVGDVQNQAVLLVDDVVTTGSTMSACAAALKSAGATSVWGLALAREV